MKNAEIGKIGEDTGYRYLLNNKYLILARNHKERFNEIDIIARHPDGKLIFCEVKTINHEQGLFWAGFMPEDHLSPWKHHKMIRAAEVFILRHPAALVGDRGWQLDLIAVVLINGRSVDVRHYENI